MHGGWCLPTRDRLHAKFNETAPLSLLHLDAAVRGPITELPPYVPSRGYIHGQYEGLGRTTDATAIWAVKR